MMDRSTRAGRGEMDREEAGRVFSASSIAMVITNPRLEDNPIIYVNDAFVRLTGYSAESAVGRNCRFLQGENTETAAVRKLKRAIDSGDDAAVKLKNYRSDGSEFVNALLISPVRDDAGQLLYFLGFQRGLSPTEKDEELTRVQTLVAELQHRVKNHLSMVIGLIRMEARESDAAQEFLDLSRRVESLQLLYEEMTAAIERQDHDVIALGAYLGRVASAIAHLDGRPGVRMNIDVPPVNVETDAAVRIGLIVSEIVTNAMQHAFRDQTSGLVELRVTSTDRGGLRCTITDDGVGLPKEMDWPGEGGLGSRIVQGLCHGLGATLNVNRGAIGTVVVLDVPNVVVK